MKKILVVDDEILNREIIKRVLKKEGFCAVEAKNGKEALEILKTQQIDLVLMDIMMPVMDGFEAIKAIKEDSYFDNLPIIVISALSDVQTDERISKFKIDSFITKPINLILLVKKVKMALKV